MVKRNFTESHWQFFIASGAISLLVGWLVLFFDGTSLNNLIVIVAITLLAFGIIDLVHLMVRKRLNEGWGLNLLTTFCDIVFGAALLATLNIEAFWPLLILAAYTFFRGVFELLLAFRVLTDSTDRFIWITCGICGCVLGFVILNAGTAVGDALFVHIFGTYLMIYGLSNLIYGVYNKNRLANDKSLAAARRKIAQAYAKNAQARRKKSFFANLFNNKKK